MSMLLYYNYNYNIAGTCSSVKGHISLSYSSLFVFFFLLLFVLGPGSSNRIGIKFGYPVFQVGLNAHQLKAGFSI